MTLGARRLFRPRGLGRMLHIGHHPGVTLLIIVILVVLLVVLARRNR